MVEVLVALVVMSVGMLGIASLYVTALQAKTTSGSRMKAVNLAYDIADRIRANPTATASYLLAAGAATPAQNCATATCSAAQMAAADLNAWNTLVTSAITGLPGASSANRSIVQTAAPTAVSPEILTITLTWTEVNSGTLTYALEVQI